MNPQVILLAAGKSTRVWPLSEKIFFEFMGKTVLQHQIEALLTAGLKDICVVGNGENLPRIDSICQELAGNFTFAEQKNLNEGVRGGILAAQGKIDEEKPVLIVCSNDMVEISAFKNTLDQAISSDSEVFLVGKKVENYFPGGYLSLNGENRIERIVEKPKPGTEPSDLVTILIHLYKKPARLFAELQKWSEGDGYEDVLQVLFDDGVAAEAVEYNDYWQAIKYPWHLIDVARFFLQKIKGQYIHPDSDIAKNVVINGDVIIEAGVRIFDFAVINGPAYIGKNTIVANHVLIRSSHIGEECVIGQGSEIARSILQGKCWTHRNFVGDSIFDRNVSLGAGTTTGNLRLDEEEIFSQVKKAKTGAQRNKFGTAIGRNVRIGINTSIMPGVKIGSGNFLGAGITCHEDIAEKKFTIQRTPLISKDNNKEILERKDF